MNTLQNKFPDISVPRSAVFELTYKCNHACRFCSCPWFGTDSKYSMLPELSESDWIRAAEKLIGYGIESIAFSGGEPLLRGDFPEIFRQISKMEAKVPVFDRYNKIVGEGRKKLNISVITNGGLVDKSVVKMFADAKVMVTVSLPGIRTYEYHTGGGDVKKALDAISAFSEAGLKVTAGICVTNKNLSELFETISAAFLSGAVNLLLNRFLVGGRGRDNRHLSLSRSEITTMLDIAEEVCLEAKTYGSVGTELPRCLIEKKYKMMTVGTTCSGGVDFFAVDPSGKVRPCNHSPIKTGSIWDIESAISEPYWQTFKKKTFLPEMCGRCPSIYDCDGGCREAAHICGGSLNSPDPVFLEENKNGNCCPQIKKD
ncbi:MAG: radical SAM protein [Candidatus Riflebacteria bacterium]|nr:radical SAM protein [Candidatus Riflebacteria bacterium]